MYSRRDRSARAPWTYFCPSTRSTARWGSIDRPPRSSVSHRSERCSGGGRARSRREALMLLDLQTSLRDQHARLAGLSHRLREPVLLDPRPDLEIAVAVEELRGHRDQLRHLPVIVLELEDLGISLEVVEVIDRAQRKLTLQIPADDADLGLVERRVIQELPPLRRELAVVRESEPVEGSPLLVGQLNDRLVRLIDHLVGGDLVRADLDVRGERLDHQGARRRRRRRGRVRSRGLRRWRRARVERARQPIEELPPGRRQVALGQVTPRKLAPRSAVLRRVHPGDLSPRPRLDALRRYAGSGRRRSLRLDLRRA